MQLGVTFPQTEIGADPAVIKDYAQTAEDLGYEYLLVYDHVIGANPERPGGWRGPYTDKSSFHEPFVLFGYLAGLTQKLELVTGIIILPQRPAVLVAKQAAAVDVLSGGRLRLGVGIGWNAVEYEALGYDFGTRGKRVEEQVMLMRELWTKPLVTFDGEYHTISDAGLNPMPVQQPIPLWFGGTADAALRRIARMGDGWMVNRTPLERGKAVIEAMHGYVEEAGRDFADFGIDIRINLGDFPPQEWAAQVEGWRELGATHLSINTMSMGLESPGAHIATIRRFWETVRG